MNHHSAILRPYNKTNNENDENSTIKNLIFKQISKVPQASINPKGTMRGILGEVGNMTLSTKPIISKPKIIQQQQNSNVLPPSSTIVNNQIEDIILDKNFECLLELPIEFDCDSADLYNITTVSEYVGEICKYWRELEQRSPLRQNFLLHRREGRFLFLQTNVK